MKIFVTFSVTNLKCAWALNSFVSQRQQLQQQLQRVVVVVVDAAVALHRCAKLQTSIIFHCVISLRSGELFYQSQSHRYVCLYVSVLNVLDGCMYVDVCVCARLGLGSSLRKVLINLLPITFCCRA